MKPPITVTMVAYDSSWPLRFEAEREALRRLFDPVFVCIEHIGSTAVPSMAAKPIIDIMLGAAHLADVEARVSALVASGWEYRPQHEALFPERRFFVRPVIQPRTVHLHAVEITSAFWTDHLLFRDFLRLHPEAASEYQMLKIELAKKFVANREAYTEAKAPFIQSIIEKARRAIG